MIAHEYIPAFVEGCSPRTGEFETKEQLLAIPFVNRFSQNARFDHYAKERDGNTLLAFFKDPKVWRVIALFRNGELKEFDLPLANYTK